VTAKKKDVYPNKVSVSHQGQKIWSGSQRDFYRKYNWPARSAMVSALVQYGNNNNLQ